MLEPILQQLGAGNPQLAQLIAANPQRFIELLSEEGDDDVPLPPGAQTISVTEEERDAIDRVSAVPCFYFYSSRRLEVNISIFVALWAGFRARPSHPSVLCLRQE